MKGFLLVLSVFLMALLPTVIAVTIYLSLFHELNWLYPLVSIGVWFLSQFVAVKSAKEGWGMGVFYEGVGGAMGWVWMLSLPATLWFFISAIFMDGSWSKLIYTFAVGTFAQMVTRQFKNSLNEWHLGREVFEESNKSEQETD